MHIVRRHFISLLFLFPASVTAQSLTPTQAVQEYRQGIAERDTGKFADAARRFDRVARSSHALRDDAWLAAAECHVHDGHADRALEAIAAAVSAGYRDHDWLRRDTALATLHGDTPIHGAPRS